MKISEDPQFRAQILRQIAEREFYERKGTHGSDLIYCLNKQALRKLKPMPNTDEQILTFSIGWSTQRWLTGTFEPDKEYEVDGIVVTPDMILMGGNKTYYNNEIPVSIGWENPHPDGFPWELKATYQSANKSIEDNIHWMRQLMAECYVTGTTTAILSRFEIMGDWKNIFGNKKDSEPWRRPTLGAWRVEFTQEELDRFWEWMLDRKMRYENLLAGYPETGLLLPKIVALASGQEWECGWCPYKEECEKNPGRE